MIVNVQFLARPGLFEKWRQPLENALGDLGITAALASDHAPETVDYLIYAPGGVDDLSAYTRARAVLGIWAGVETIISNPTLTQPYARMVDPGLTQGMIDYVAGHVLRHHLGMDADITRTDPDWAPHIPPLASHRRVGVLGLGTLGAACAAALAGLGFATAGWSSTPKSLPGVACHHGADGLDAVLATSEILVLLLPHTPQTESLLDAARLAQLPRGAVLINPGRGALIDDAALLDALGSGQVGHATLDTFRIEPLPRDHPFWTHPQVTVTPHIASETRPESAARVIAENIRRGEAGEPFLHLVDKARGY